jgi:hypothetical protein
MRLAAPTANASLHTGSFRISERLDDCTMISAKKACGIRWHDAGLLLLRPCTARAGYRRVSMAMHAHRKYAGPRHSRIPAAAGCLRIIGHVPATRGPRPVRPCWQASCMDSLPWQFAFAGDCHGDVGNQTRRNRVRPGRRS